MSTLAAPRPAPVVREAAAGGAAAAAVARARRRAGRVRAFAGLHWMALLEPAAPGPGVGGGRRSSRSSCSALLGAARLPRPLGWVAAALVALAAIALALLAGGLADEYLRPDRWSELLAGAGRGIEALPGVRVPYRGAGRVDAARDRRPAGRCSPCSPRCSRSGRGAAAPASPPLALLALVTLYVVPAVVLDFDGEFLRGARARAADARLPAAREAARARRAGRRRRWRPRPRSARWSPRRRWTAASRGGTTRAGRSRPPARRRSRFSWDHDYSPLDWPRDGRELLRVKARSPAYWKASDLDAVRRPHAGARTRASAASAPAPAARSTPSSLARWSQRIEVTLRNLRTDTFVTAGHRDGGRRRGRLPDRRRRLQRAATGSGRGDSYAADVYTPQPERAPAARAPAPTTRTGCAATCRCYLPEPRAGAGDDPRGRTSSRPRRLRPLWGERRAARGRALRRLLETGRPAAARSELARAWALAQELQGGSRRRRSSTSSGRGATSTTGSPTPSGRRRRPRRSTASCSTPRSASASSSPAPRRCCCGWPASPPASRPASRPARSTRSEKEYVVRDLDAHSWVEAWFPGFGWVTRDPTPAALRRASQPGDDERRRRTPATRARRTSAASASATSRATARSPQDEGTGSLTWILGGARGAALISRRGAAPAASAPAPPAARAAPAGRVRARAGARALRRGPGTTLSAWSARSRGWPGAVGYVRALREQRYSGRPAAPTAEQRRGLRAALARDAGTLRVLVGVPPERG